MALTQEQCIQYQLPRTPIKETERRAGGFEARFGVGATELDALEALHPGALRQILVEHIERYYDSDLADNVEEATESFGDLLDEAEEEVSGRYEDEILALDELRDAIARTFEEVHEPALRAYREAVARASIAYDAAVQPVRDRIMEMEQEFTEEAESLIAAMAADMELAAPEGFAWPEPADGDEDDDALYDSTRDYIEQVDRFRRHQGKEDDVGLAEDRVLTKTCAFCRKPFTTPTKQRTFCSDGCRDKSNRREVRARRDGLSQAGKDNPD